MSDMNPHPVGDAANRPSVLFLGTKADWDGRFLGRGKFHLGWSGIHMLDWASSSAAPFQCSQKFVPCHVPE